MNAIGWQIALILTSIFVRLLGGWGALLSGSLLGGVIGIAQGYALFSTDDEILWRMWTIYSAIGGFLGIFPAVVLALLGVFNVGLAGFLVGAMFTGILGILQSMILVTLLEDDSAYLWILVCLLAGGVAGWLLTPFVQVGVPFLLSPSFIVFGLITGWVLQKWIPTTIEDTDELNNGEE